MIMKLNRYIVTLFGLLLATSLIAAGPDKDDDNLPTTQPTQGGIKKVKSAKGTATSTPKLVKFQINTKEWRAHIKAELDKSGGGQSGNIRIALMAETARDTKGAPVNWRQLDQIFQGIPPQDITKEFDNGLGKDGKPMWFALSITGNTTNYEVTVEDHSAPPEDAKPKRKSKKKKED